MERAAEGKRQAALRDRIEAGLREMSTGIVIFGERAERLPNTLAFADPSLRAETALMALDLSGIAVSSGSACSSGKIKASHVLAAMGVPAGIIECGLRVSLGRTTTEADAERFLDVFKRVRNGIHDRNNMRAA